MERYKKIGLTTFLVIGLVAFVLLMNSYYRAPNVFVGKSVVMQGIIPENAKLVDSIEDDVLYNGIFYGYDVDFSPVKVNGHWFFEKKPLDEVRFSVRFNPMDVSGQRNKASIFIRGINYSELPRVYDYQTEYVIKAEGLGIFNWYESRFYVSEKAPWTVTTKYVKNGLSTGIKASLLAAIIIGLVSAIGTTIIQQSVDVLYRVESKKEDGLK